MTVLAKTGRLVTLAKYVPLENIFFFRIITLISIFFYVYFSMYINQRSRKRYKMPEQHLQINYFMSNIDMRWRKMKREFNNISKKKLHHHTLFALSSSFPSLPQQ